MSEKVDDSKSGEFEQALAGWHEAVAQVIDLQEQVITLQADLAEIRLERDELLQTLRVERDRQHPARFRVRESNRER